MGTDGVELSGGRYCASARVSLSISLWVPIQPSAGAGMLGFVKATIPDRYPRSHVPIHTNRKSDLAFSIPLAPNICRSLKETIKGDLGWTERDVGGGGTLERETRTQHPPCFETCAKQPQAAYPLHPTQCGPQMRPLLRFIADRTRITHPHFSHFAER